MVDGGATADRSAVVGASRWRFLQVLGPGLVTGAADDDPSGIATYTQAGAALGYGAAWTALFSYPLMVAVQIISARIGRVTGAGLSGNLRAYYPNWIAYCGIVVLLVANTINLGADIGAMAESVRTLIGGPAALYVVGFGIASAAAEIVLKYEHYVAALKWLTLGLLAYVATLLFVHVDGAAFAAGLFVPRLSLSADYLTTIVAILGTTISPYLFFWQSSQEAEDVKAAPWRRPLRRAPRQAASAYSRIQLDTVAGMGFSNAIALAIMATAAATLHASGQTNVQTAADAAAALKPLAGPYAQALFALGVVGTGLLGVPVLAGSAAYAIGEALRWPTGLGRAPREAKAFYAVIAFATGAGALMNFTPIDPIRALFWSAVINGVAAAPVMVAMMAIAGNRKVMDRFVVEGPLRIVGWLATGVMAAAAVAMLALQVWAARW